MVTPQFSQPHGNPSRDGMRNKLSEYGEPENIFTLLDKTYQAKLARMTLGVSPASITEIFSSWAGICIAPGKALSLAFYPALHVQDCMNRLAGGSQHPNCVSDPRFHSENWQHWPWCMWAEGFQQLEDFWRDATKGIPGVTEHNEQVVAFAARQILTPISHQLCCHQSRFIF